jgi:hypothetical protein
MYGVCTFRVGAWRRLQTAAHLGADVALSIQHRTTIHRKLSPIIGDEEAQGMLAYFPIDEGQEPATKDFVRAEMGKLRAEMHQLNSRTILTLIMAMVAIDGTSTAAFIAFG